MLPNGKDFAEVVLEAVQVLGNPGSTQQHKKQAHVLLTKAKESNTGTTLGVASVLCRQKQDDVAMFGYNLFSEVVKKRWKECTDAERKDLATFTWKCLTKAGDVGPSAPIRAAVCQLCGLLLSREEQQSLVAGWGKVLEFGGKGPRQFGLMCQVGKVLTSQATELDSTEEGDVCTGPRLDAKIAQRSLVANLGIIGPKTVAFLSKSVERYYHQGVEQSKLGNSENVTACADLVSTGLTSIGHWVDFMPLTVLAEAGVVHACQALVNLSQFGDSVLDIIDKVVQRKDVSEAEVVVGAKCGQIAMSRLERMHTKRREKRLDTFGKDFQSLNHAITSSIEFASQYAERLYNDDAKLGALVAQVLSVFKFQSVELAAASLSFWHWALNPRPLNVFTEFSQSLKRALSSIAKDLATCLFGLYEHMQVSSGEEDNFIIHFDMVDFREKYNAQVAGCLTNLAQIYPATIRSHITSIAKGTLAACNSREGSPENRVALMRRLSYVLEHASQNQAMESELIKMALRETLEELLRMDIGANMELALWFGEALKCCTKAVQLNKELVGLLIPRIIYMMCRLPMATAGLGLPLVGAAKYKTFSEARMNLCIIVRSLVEQTPGPVLLTINSYMAKIDKAKKEQRLSMAEYITFVEVAVMASLPGSMSVQEQILTWSLEGLRKSWGEKTWIYMLQNGTDFGDQYLAYDVRSDGSVCMIERDLRWELYHEILLISKVLSRCPRKKWRSSKEPIPDTAAKITMDLVYVVGKVMRSIQMLWDVCKGHAVWSEILELKSTPESPTTKRSELQEGLAVSDISIASCRLWMEVIFRKCGSILGSTGFVCPFFWDQPQLCQRLPKLITEPVQHMRVGYCKDLLEQVLIPWVTLCPIWKQQTWVLPILEIVPQLHKKIKDGWEAVENSQFADLKTEIAYQAFLQDDTEQFAKLLEAIGAGLNDETTRTKSKSVFDRLLDEQNTQCREIIQYTMYLLALRNWSVIEPVVQFCRYLVTLSHRYKDIQNLVTSEMLPRVLDLLFDGGMANVGGPLVCLLGDILSKYLGSDEGVIRCMMKIPGMTEQKLQMLSRNLVGGHKMKEHLMDTLMNCCGDQLLALGLVS
ncbi:hypothetical protein BSKO_01003 [Bryopsis sp. KO-2023]|nr:hypothetical protein BSKO_01003 [Bryopsis sp. KO-2023]